MTEKVGDFLKIHREEIMRRFEARLRQGHAPDEALRSELRDGLPGYLELLSQAQGVPLAQEEEIEAACAARATEHGGQRLRLGFDPGSVVREYGLLYDCIFELAEEVGHPASGSEMRDLADRFNLASSQAVAQYVRLRDEQLRHQEAQHLSFLAHELRGPLHSAQLAIGLLAIKTDVGRSKAGQALLRSITRLRDLIDGALTSGLLADGFVEYLSLSLVELLAEALAESDMYAQSKDVRLLLSVEEGLTVEGDTRLLRSAVSNIVRNAIKFTTQGTVQLRAMRKGSMARVEVEDCCGGLTEEKVAMLFQPFVQVGGDRSGFGLGLAITRQAVLAHGGQVFVENLPGKGCVFGFEIPLMAAPKAASEFIAE